MDKDRIIETVKEWIQADNEIKQLFYLYMYFQYWGASFGLIVYLH